MKEWVIVHFGQYYIQIYYCLGMQIDAIQKIHVSRWNENRYTNKNSYFMMKVESIERITD